MKITVDRTKCEGYAKCIQATPKVFKLDAKMIAEVVDAKGDSDEKILLAEKLPHQSDQPRRRGNREKTLPCGVTKVRPLSRNQVRPISPSACP